MRVIRRRDRLDRNARINEVQNKQNTSAHITGPHLSQVPGAQRENIWLLTFVGELVNSRSNISAYWQTDFLFSSAVRLITDYKIKHC